MTLDLEKIDLGSFGISDKETDPTQPLKSTMSEAIKVNPDQAARVNKLSKDSGVPQFAVEQSPDEVETDLKLKQIDFSTMSKRNPNTSAYLVDFNNASIAHDDIDVLQFIENTWSSLYGAGKDIAEVPGDVARSVDRLTENIGATIALGFKSQARGGLMKGVESSAIRIEDLIPMSAMPMGFESEALDMSREVASRFGIESDEDLQVAKDEAVTGLIDQVKAIQEVRKSLIPDDLTLVEEGVRAGIESIANMAPGVALMALSGGRATPLLTTMGVQTFSESFGSARADGLDSDDATWKASVDAAIEVGTELLPLGTLTKIVTGKSTGVTKDVLKFTVKEMGTEQLATLGQTLNDYAFGLDEELQNATTTSEMVDIQLRRQAVTAIATIVAGGAQATAAAGVNKTIQKLSGEQSQQETKTATEQKTIDDINKATTESKLKSRDPDSFKQFIKQVDGENNTHVFIDGVQAALYLQGKTQEEVQADPTLVKLQDATREAARLGTDVAVPVDEFAVSYAGTEVFDALRDSMTMSEDTVAPFRQDQVKTEMRDYMGRLVQEAQKNGSQYVEAQRIFEDTKQQLIDTGRMTPQNAGVMAKIVPAWVTTTAARTGRTVEEVAATLPTILGPQSGRAADLAAREIVLSQKSELDQILNEFDELGFSSDLSDAELLSLLGVPVPQRKRRLLESIGVSKDAAWTDERLDRVIRENLSVNGTDTDTRIAFVNPADFVNSTHPDPQVIADEAGQLDQVRLTDESDTPFLWIGDAGVIVGHEGRHRMAAMSAAGINRVPVRLKFLNGTDFADTIDESLPYKFQGQQFNEGTGVDLNIDESYIALPENRELIKESMLRSKPELLFQEARGYYDPANSIIRLTESSDLSTFLHEFAHFMYEMEKDGGTLLPEIQQWIMRNADDVANEAVRTPEGLKSNITGADVEAFINNQTTGDSAKDQAINRAIHEQFARGFETYLMEGKAPSVGLRKVFSQMARWLAQVYQSVKNDLKVNLDADMRSVFDRLLATEQQIADAEGRARIEPLFTDATMAGMTDEQWQDYQEKQAQSSNKAAETVRDKLIEEITRKTKKAWKEEKQDVIDEQTDVISKEPVYVARDRLRNSDVKLDLATAKQMASETKTDTLGRTSTRVNSKLNGMVKGGAEGIHPDEAAALFGYSSGAELINDLISAPPLKEAAETAAEAEMKRRHGDILNDGTIEQLADDALRNEERGDVMLAELKVLGRITNRKTLDKQIMKDVATERIGKLSYRELFPGTYRKAEIKAAQDAAVALKEGNMEAAAEAKTRQLLNFYLGKAATEAKADIITVSDKMNRYGKTRVRAEIMKAENGYMDQIDKILSRFEFRKSATLKSVENINTWVNDRTNLDGDALMLSPETLDELYVTHWKNVPYDELIGISDSVKNIEHVARYANKIKRGEDEMSFKEFVQKWVDHMNKQPTRFKRVASVADKPNAAVKFGRYAMAQMTKIPFLASWLDGGERVGMSHDTLVQPFNDAYAAEMQLWSEVGRPVIDLLENRSKADMKRHNTKYFIPEIKGTNGHTGNLMGHEILAVALNTGNAGNLRKMLLGEGWANPEFEQEVSFDNPKLQAVLQYMTVRDWQLVQSIWDQMETLYPKLAEVHRETTGLTPPKVDATPVETEFGTFKGGYYPVKYDPQRDFRAQQNEDKLNAETESMFSNMSLSAQVSAGATNERTGYYAPIRLSLDVVPSHFQETIHYITHHRAVRETNKLIRNKQVAQTITEKLGEDEFRQLRPWLNDIAKDGREAPTKMWWEKALQRLRFGTTLGVMGFKASTGIIQISGLSNTVAEVGLSNVMQASRSILGSPNTMRDAWQFANDNSKIMKYRTETMDREIRNAMQRIEGKRGILAAVQEASMKHIALIQAYMVDLPSWHAAYIKSMKEHGDEQRAYRYADWVVENVQGSGLTKDMAQIMRNQNEANRMFTMFMTFFSSLWNMERDLIKGARSGVYSTTNISAKLMFLFTIPVLFEMMIRGELGGDEEPEEMLQGMLTKVALYPVQSVPFVRDIASGAAGDFGYNISPLAQLLETGVRTIPEVVERGFTDEEVTKSQVKGATRFIGAAIGIPGTSQAWATGEHLYDVIEEGEEFTTHQLLFGPKREK